MSEDQLLLSRERLQDFFNNDIEFKGEKEDTDREKDPIVFGFEELTREDMEFIDKIWPFKDYKIAEGNLFIYPLTEEEINKRDVWRRMEMKQAMRYELSKEDIEKQLEGEIEDYQDDEDEDIMDRVDGDIMEKGKEMGEERIEDAFMDEDTEVEKEEKRIETQSEDTEETEEDDGKWTSKCKECGEEFSSDDMDEADQLLDEHYEEQHEEDEEDKNRGEGEKTDSDLDLDKSQRPNGFEGEVEEKEEVEIPVSYDEFKKTPYSTNSKQIRKAMVEAGKESTIGEIVEEILVEEEDIKYNKKQYVRNVLKNHSDFEFNQGTREKEGRGKGKAVYTLENERYYYKTEPIQVRDEEGRIKTEGYTDNELIDMTDLKTSEVIMTVLSEEGPQSVEELTNKMVEDPEEAEWKIKRILLDYTNGYLNSTERDTDGEEVFYLQKEVREKFTSSERSPLFKLLQETSHRVKCSECGKRFDGSVEARRHRREDGHFDWEKAELMEGWSNEDKDDWRTDIETASATT